MQKAQFSSTQRSHALAAGAVGHVLFSIGWLMVGFVVLGGGITLLLGGTANGVTGLFRDIPALKDFLSNAGNVIGVIVILGALVWWWMTWLRRGSASPFAGVTATGSATAVIRPPN